MTTTVPAPAADAVVAPGIPAHGDTVAWRRVVVFSAIAYAGVSLCGLGLVVTGSSMRRPAAAVVAGVLAMACPLVAGVVTERLAGRRTLLARGWERFRTDRAGTLRRVAVAALAAIGVVVVSLLLGATVFQPVPGAGRWAGQADFDATVHALSPTAPTVPVLVVLAGGIVQAVLAGFTVNGLAAFGEEYGWRGVLAEELRPLGAVRANLFTGVLWGLWHAPLIAMGHDYGDAWALGIPLFVLITTPMSFILWRVRELAGSVVASAVVHGAFNGVSGIFVLLLAGANRLIAVPVGVLGGVCLTVAASVVWHLPGRVSAVPTRPAATPRRSRPR